MVIATHCHSHYTYLISFNPHHNLQESYYHYAHVTAEEAEVEASIKQSRQLTWGAVAPQLWARQGCHL